MLRDSMEYVSTDIPYSVNILNSSRLHIQLTVTTEQTKCMVHT